MAVRGDTLNSLINNHTELINVWESGIPSTTDTEIKARMIGVQTTMRKLSFFIWVFNRSQDFVSNRHPK